MGALAEQSVRGCVPGTDHDAHEIPTLVTFKSQGQRFPLTHVQIIGYTPPSQLRQGVLVSVFHESGIRGFNLGNRFDDTSFRLVEAYSLARIGKNWRQEKSFSSMGPEPLSEEFTGASMRKKFANKNAPVKTVLLDQSVVAGIGNIYACEALFHAGIDPAKKAGEISAPKIEKLVQAIRSVLLRAIEAGGSTLRDHRRTDGSEGYFQHDFSVYDREGKPCPDCRCDIATTGGIHRIAQAGRSTFYCPGKQK